MSPIEKVLAALRAAGCKPVKSGNGWAALCPAHPDKRPSLSVAVGDNGGVVRHCHAGCSLEAVAAALGLRPADFMAPNGSKAPRRAVRPTRPARTYATAEAALRAYGLGEPDKVWTYETAQGDIYGAVGRWNLPDGGKDIRPVTLTPGGWKCAAMPEPRPLYRLAVLRELGGPVFVTEGEKAADCAAALGLLATTSPSGAQAAGKADWQPLAGRDVVLLPDADTPGQKYAAQVAGILAGLSPPARVRVVNLPDLPDGGDVADFRPGEPPERVRAEIEALAAAAAPVEAADVQALFTGGEPEAEPEPEADGPLLPRYVSAAALARAKPRLRPPVVHGLLREGETLNIIAPSKTGKSWLALSLAASVASGRPWLGAFETEPGPVLIVDNELHEETIARRVPQVIEALCLPPDTAELVYVESLRGRLVNLHNMRHYFGAIEPRLFRVVVLDAFYRFLPAGISENDNGALAGLFNAMDAHAARLGCAFVCIHHSTKGSQAAKAVVDVGSGAGAMARAADSHCILRAHEEPGAYVLEAVARSWPPPEALALRWTWPTFTPAPELSPLDLKPERTRRQRAPKAEKPPKPTMDVATFAAECVGNGDGAVSATAVGRAVDKGLSQAAAGLLLKRAEAEGYIRRVVSGPCEPHTFVLAEGGGTGYSGPHPRCFRTGGGWGGALSPLPPLPNGG